jgi:hypothetical protein
MRGPFAWPFKVLRDLFSNPPFVADPEFARIDMDALRGKWSLKDSYPPETSRSSVLRIDRAQFVFWVWLLELILLPLLALIFLK